MLFVCVCVLLFFFIIWVCLISQSYLSAVFVQTVNRPPPPTVPTTGNLSCLLVIFLCCFDITTVPNRKFYTCAVLQHIQNSVLVTKAESTSDQVLYTRACLSRNISTPPQKARQFIRTHPTPTLDSLHCSQGKVSSCLRIEPNHRNQDLNPDHSIGSPVLYTNHLFIAPPFLFNSLAFHLPAFTFFLLDTCLVKTLTW